MIEPDTKDWTWVLDRRCPECGYDAAGVDRRALGASIRDDAAGWVAMLAVPGVGDRPDEGTWSPLEYACHVRDVHVVMGERLALMLDHDEPTFANWDQDATAVESRYREQSAAVVAAEVVAAAEAVAARYDALVAASEVTWARPGRRSNGSRFTVDSLARYHVHDLVHHAHDVRAVASRATAAAYDASADAFATATSALVEPLRSRLETFAGAVGAGGTVLEIGSGGGRDAAALEALGVRVRRTDVSLGFVTGLRDRGFEADALDPLVDELGGPYDGVWASACLLHVARPDLPVVLRRLAGAVRPGGVLGLSLKQGEGEAWSTHGSVTAPRRFVYWREGPLRVALTAAGWDVEILAVEISPFNDQPWLLVHACRR